MRGAQLLELLAQAASFCLGLLKLRLQLRSARMRVLQRDLQRGALLQGGAEMLLQLCQLAVALVHLCAPAGVSCIRHACRPCGIEMLVVLRGLELTVCCAGAKALVHAAVAIMCIMISQVMISAMQFEHINT